MMAKLFFNFQNLLFCPLLRAGGGHGKACVLSPHPHHSPHLLTYVKCTVRITVTNTGTCLSLLGNVLEVDRRLHPEWGGAEQPTGPAGPGRGGVRLTERKADGAEQPLGWNSHRGGDCLTSAVITQVLVTCSHHVSGILTPPKHNIYCNIVYLPAYYAIYTNILSPGF